MKVLVTGADGFVGQHLVRHLDAHADTVTAAVGPAPRQSEGVRSLDMRDGSSVAALIADTKPDAIYHLAAVSYGPEAAHDLSAAIDVTVRGTASLLQAAADLSPPPVVLIAGSSEVYGAPDHSPIDESTPVRPVTLYGATKAAQEALGLAFAAARRVPVVVTRSFNHIGPGQRSAFVVPSFTRQLAEIRAGRTDPVLRVGNLDRVRDFTDVRDVVRAYRLLVSGRHVEQPINVASGRGVAVREILEELIRLAGLDVQVETDPARVRSSDPERLVGDAGRLRELTGWQPEIPLRQTLADVWASYSEAA